MAYLTRLSLLRGGAALALAGLATAALALPPDRFYAKTAPSVWRVIAYDADGIAFSQGSGVVIAKETLLTNCHVLAKARRFAVKQDNASYEARLQYIDVARDMCQITARNLPAPPAEIGDSDKLAVGQRVYALGNPRGLELTLSDGLVSALRKDDNGRLVMIQTTAPVSPGSSGGGLFDEEGRLIGLTTLQLKEAQNLNFAVPVNWLRDLPARSAAALAQMKAVPPAARPAGPAASGYADINDLSKLDRYRESVRSAYQDFLKRPLPRAFALSDNGGSYQAWGRVPRDPADSPDPAVRVIAGCEKYHQSRCRLYAIDQVVVYKPDQQ